MDCMRKVAEVLAPKYTYTEAEVRLVMAGMQVELEALRKDAERYRWLRANTHGEKDRRGRQEFCMPDPCPRANIMRGSVAQHLDAAIDADMLEDETVRKAVGAG